MPLAVLSVLVVFIAIIFYVVLQNRPRPETDEERTKALITRAHRMFPNAKTRIDALDLLYQPYYREWKLATDEARKEDADRYKRDLRLIFHAKNRAIEDALQFENEIITTQQRSFA